MSDTLLTAPEVSKRLKIGLRTFWRWVAQRNFPAPIYLSARSVRWREADVEAFLNLRRGKKGD